MPVITYSRRGGMTLEALYRLYPETIKQVFIDPIKGIDMNEIGKVAVDLGVQDKQSTLSFLIKNLYECFTQRDCVSIQLSPLVLTKDNKFRAANVIIHIDNDAAYRQIDLSITDDLSQKPPLERMAKDNDLRYHYLGGDIGLVTNSGGGCMAICDLLE